MPQLRLCCGGVGMRNYVTLFKPLPSQYPLQIEAMLWRAVCFYTKWQGFVIIPTYT